MKKYILISLVAVFMATAVGVSFAQSNVTGLSASANFDVNCVKPLVEKRETALIASYDKMSSCIKTAMTQRKTSILEAWVKPTIRQEEQRAIRGGQILQRRNALASKHIRPRLRPFGNSSTKTPKHAKWLLREQNRKSTIVE